MRGGTLRRTKQDQYFVIIFHSSLSSHAASCINVQSGFLRIFSKLRISFDVLCSWIRGAVRILTLARHKAEHKHRQNTGTPQTPHRHQVSTSAPLETLRKTEIDQLVELNWDLLEGQSVRARCWRDVCWPGADQSQQSWSLDPPMIFLYFCDSRISNAEVWLGEPACHWNSKYIYI